MQRAGLIFFATLIAALFPPAITAQDAPASPAPAPAQHQRVQAFVGIAYEDTPVSVREQPVYCPVLGQQCSPPGAIFTNHEGLKGWEVAAAHHFSPGFALVADIAGVSGNGTTGFPTEAKAHQHTFLGGPELSRPGKRFSPYVHALFGAAHQTATSSGNSFFTTFPDNLWGYAAAAGVGIDIKISQRASFRLVQADYLATHFNNKFQSQPRISIGILLRF